MRLGDVIQPVDANQPPVVAALKISAPDSTNVLVATAFIWSDAPASQHQASELQLWQQKPEANIKRYLAQVVQGQTLRLGRSRSNDLVVDDGSISRYHAVLIASESGILLSDLSSLNGTFVNDRRITTPTNLNTGDRVSLGEHDFTFEVEFQLSSQKNTTDSSIQQTQTAGMKVVNVTILLADICGYTKMSQTLPVTDVARTLQSWFQRVNQIVQRHGGQVDKYIGDCVMALWSGSIDQPAQGAIAATHAAQEILVDTQHFSQGDHWVHRNQHPWNCRVALNTGSALSGSLGARESREFAVLGDSINVAFRLEGVASKFATQIILGEQTAALITPEIAVQCLGTVELEGRSGTVQVYTLQ